VEVIKPETTSEDDMLRNRKGFTLIELMIVVVIIGILAALAIPRFMRATTKSKQSEAKELLKQIYTMERAYFQESVNSNYFNGGNVIPGGTVPQLGIEVMASARYNYNWSVFNATAFTVIASGNLDDDPAIDEWSISGSGILTSVTDDAAI
jgi:prepilin-type N-terminal cleavage/methylation domain-containing protein